MTHPISDFMANWLNTTYKYLKETGGPTYPVKPVTVGPGVLPTGEYSLVEDYPIEDYPSHYRYVTFPFNAGATGIPATANSQNEFVEEIAKENPTPPVLSSNFQRLYSGMMNACISDQMHGHGNPNARSACQNLADTGDISEMMLVPYQKEAIGLVPIPQENAKSDAVRLAESEASLTSQIKTGVQEGFAAWKGFTMAANTLVKKDPSGNKTITGDPAGNNFQSLNDRLKAFFPGIPDMPDFNSPVIMIGGAVILVVLLIAVVK